MKSLVPEDPFVPAPGATPIDPEERQQLRQNWITTKSDLNEAEQRNILLAFEAHFGRDRPRDPLLILDADFLKRVHRDMFGEVWAWAGAYRRSQKNIGVPWVQIPIAIAELIRDTRDQIALNSFPPDEIAIRFHHRLVAIHLFPNGNGRHSRAVADLLALSLGRPRFTWGGGGLADVGDLRKRYIDALIAADGHDTNPIIVFSRS